MNDKTESSCPKCGASIPDDAPQGLCPKCVLIAAATVANPDTPPAGNTTHPTVEELAGHFPELEILELIGSGGMGAVYKARQPKLDRFVAVKILSHTLSADPAFAERFNREARVLARLNHPHIVTVFDFGTQGPFCYLLMEYVDGVNLRQAMRAGGFAPAETLALVQDICAALAFAHEEGILHRDIKPENVLLDARGRVKIADFGIAKLVGQDERDDFTLTMQGAVLGTPHYMAPEQIETPGDVDQRADIYSLGVVFYELLTGELPLGRFAAPSEKSEMDPRVDEVVMRTLEKERKARYQSVGEVQTQVEALTHSPSAAPAQVVASTTPAPGSRAAAGTSETARFATASAILSGLGLAFIFVTGPLIVYSLAMEGIGGMELMILAVVVLLMIVVPAVLGMIFGAIGLGDIRESKGLKRGFGRAMFGAMVWPVVFIFCLMGYVVYTLLKMFEAEASIPMMIMLVMAIGIPLASAQVRSVASFVRRPTQGVQGRRKEILIRLAIGFVAVITIFLLGQIASKKMRTAADLQMQELFLESKGSSGRAEAEAGGHPKGVERP